MAHHAGKLTVQVAKGGLRTTSDATKAGAKVLGGKVFPRGHTKPDNSESTATVRATRPDVVVAEPTEAWSGNPRDMRDEDLAFFGLSR